MGFANPLSLLFFGLFAPVILLYLLKQRRRRVLISTLMFWDRILKDEQTVTSITKLKKIISLLLQLLFISLLSLSLARPLLSEKITGARRIVLVVDISASMNVQNEDQTRFKIARDKAKAVVQGMSMGDSLMLVAMSSKPDVVCPFSDQKRVLLDAVEGLSVSHSDTDFKAALDLLHHLSPDERETHVYIISDGAYETVDYDPPPNCWFAYIPVGLEENNMGITAFQLRPLPASPRDFQIHIALSNQTDEEQTAPLELWINQDLIDAHEITIPAHSSVAKNYKQFSAQGGEVRVVLDYADAFMLDNEAYAVLPAPDPIKVLLVQEKNLFLETALHTDDEVDLQVVEPSLYEDNADYDVTVFANWSPAETPEGDLIFINRFPDDLGLRVTGQIEKPLITDFDRDHPINQHLLFTNVSIEQAIRIDADDSYQVLVSSFDDPLVLLGGKDGSKVMVTAFDTLSSDLPLRVSFPILIANAIRHLADRGETGRWDNPDIGEIFAISDVERFLSSEQIDQATAVMTIVKPDEQAITIGAESGLLEVDQVGFYRMKTGQDDTAPLFTANLANANESKIKPSPTLPIRSPNPIQEIKQGFRMGLEPWYFLIILALLLIVVEWVLYHRRIIE